MPRFLCYSFSLSVIHSTILWNLGQRDDIISHLTASCWMGLVRGDCGACGALHLLSSVSSLSYF